MVSVESAVANCQLQGLTSKTSGGMKAHGFLLPQQLLDPFDLRHRIGTLNPPPSLNAASTEPQGGAPNPTFFEWLMGASVSDRPAVATREDEGRGDACEQIQGLVVAEALPSNPSIGAHVQ